MAEIKITQIDSRICVSVDGESLPDIFSGYKIDSSTSGKAELSLFVKGNISVAELSTKTLSRKQ